MQQCVLFFVTIASMQSQPTSLQGLSLIKPTIFPDDRGYFLESYNKEELHKLGIGDEFIQDNLSTNKKGVLRGLHFQKEPYAQAKLVSVVQGSVYDVAVDLRNGSPTYGKWFGVLLSAKDHTMMYIPKGFAHGFYVLEDNTRFIYKVSGSFYNKAASTGILWNDPGLGITWPLDGNEPMLSVQDRSLPPFTPFA